MMKKREIGKAPSRNIGAGESDFPAPNNGGRLSSAVPSLSSSTKSDKRAGACWWFRKYAPYDVAIKQLELEVREQQLGLWATDSPMPSWELRAQYRDVTKRCLQY